jgi:CRISPR/Cas system Type II protein with McrA/HNH and RuvC-like nuclease domain
MWYFALKQNELANQQYQDLQKKAVLTEVEIFNEPYDNLYLFEVENYKDFVDFLDLEGLRYEVTSERPSREQLMAGMR